MQLLPSIQKRRKHKRWAWLRRELHHNSLAQTSITLNISGLVAAVFVAVIGAVILVAGLAYSSTQAFDAGLSIVSLGAGGALGVTIPTVTTTTL